MAYEPISFRHSFSVSSNGTLAYRPQGRRELVWVDHEGRIEPLDVAVAPAAAPRLSPDGQRVAIQAFGLDALQVIDVERGTRTTIRQAGTSQGAFWSDDGTRIAFSSNRTGNWDLYSVSADGMGEVESLLARPLDQFAVTWSPDGQAVAYVELHPVSLGDIWILPNDGEPWPFLNSPSNELYPDFSPDGQWIAYCSDESGRREIYVQAFPEGGLKRAVSTDGGTEPRWSADGSRLFYRSGDQLMAVEMTAESMSAAVPLFAGRYEVGIIGAGYEVHPHDQRLLMVAETQVDEIRIVQNWHRELLERVPVP